LLLQVVNPWFNRDARAHRAQSIQLLDSACQLLSIGACTSTCLPLSCTAVSRLSITTWCMEPGPRSTCHWTVRQTCCVAQIFRESVLFFVLKPCCVVCRLSTTTWTQPRVRAKPAKAEAPATAARVTTTCKAPWRRYDVHRACCCAVQQRITVAAGMLAAPISCTHDIGPTPLMWHLEQQVTHNDTCTHNKSCKAIKKALDCASNQLPPPAASQYGS
jgi:hypothetical protein